jgi:hypothetical protein
MLNNAYAEFDNPSEHLAVHLSIGMSGVGAQDDHCAATIF